MKTAAWTSLGRREAAWKGPDRKGTAPCDSTHEKSWNCYNPREEVPTSPSRSRGLGEAADGLRVARMARLGRDGDGQKPPHTRLPSALYFMQLLPQYANGRNRYLKVAGPGLLCPAPWPPLSSAWDLGASAHQKLPALERARREHLGSGTGAGEMRVGRRVGADGS